MEEKILLNKFFENRNTLINQLDDKALDKKEFILKNLAFFNDNGYEPFVKVLNYEQGMFNYQYYNIWAKYYYMEAQLASGNEETEKYCQSYLDEGYYYYSKKEKTIWELLKVIKYKNIEAYYIEVESENLNGNLFEVVIKDYERALLHSKSYKLQALLDSKGLFKKEIQKSLIDAYVNKKYNE